MSVLQHFEEYQRARVKFVQAVAEAATRPQNIEVMNNAGVMQLLRPLLLDNVNIINIIIIININELINMNYYKLGSKYSTNCCFSFRSSC